MAAGPRLVADVGGTNARFALAGADGSIGEATVLQVAAHRSFEAALRAFLDAAGARPGAAAIAGAGPTDGRSIRLTNAPWTIRADAVAAALDGGPVGLFNDLEAVALALPHLASGDFETLAPGAPPERPAPRLAVNVGTGLGAALALPDPAGGWRAVASEAGHMRFAAATPDEAAIAPHVVTYEDVLSGRGFRRLQDLMADPDRRIALFSGLLGRVAGDLVLATGAWGGVYFVGGVLERWRENVAFEPLMRWFLDKGPMRARMAATPMYRLTRAAPALLGLAHAPIGAPIGAQVGTSAETGR